MREIAYSLVESSIIAKVYSQKEVREGLGCQGNLDRLSAKIHTVTNLATRGILGGSTRSGNNWSLLQGNFNSNRGILATGGFWQQGSSGNKGILVQRGFGSNKRIPIQGNFWQ